MVRQYYEWYSNKAELFRNITMVLVDPSLQCWSHGIHANIPSNALVNMPGTELH
jgi:hypothetical protein